MQGLSRPSQLVVVEVVCLSTPRAIGPFIKVTGGCIFSFRGGLVIAPEDPLCPVPRFPGGLTLEFTLISLHTSYLDLPLQSHIIVWLQFSHLVVPGPSILRSWGR
jgi:hypothetical protein